MLAISAIKKGELSNIRKASHLYNIPRTTLRERLKGAIYRNESRANSNKLTQNEEESLLKWIVSMDQRGAPPRPSHIQEMANILLSKRGSAPMQTVGVNWAYNYIK